MAKKSKKALRANAIRGMQSGYLQFYRQAEEAEQISKRNVRLKHTARQRYALLVFSKLIVHNKAILEIGADIVEQPENKMALADHFSIATLARAVIDAALMTMYISEPSLTAIEWDFRRQLIFLHDANNRSRFLKPLQQYGEIPFFEGSDELKRGVKDKIKMLGAKLLLSEEAIIDYQKGLKLFVNGQRGAAREAGWDVDMFEFHQSYYSAYVHSHPVSFLNAYQHEIRFGGISHFQADFLHSIYLTLAHYVGTVAARMDLFTVPKSGDPIGDFV